MSIRVVLIEDYHLFRIGLRRVLGQSEGIEVVGEASDLATGLEVVREHDPDVVMLELNLPDAHGLDLLRTVAAGCPNVALLVVSGFDGAERAEKSLQAGGHGFVDKSANFHEVVSAVRSVHEGRSVVSFSRRKRMIRQDPRPAASPTTVPTTGPKLSSREREVLTCLARGLTNRKAADELLLSVKPVETYRSRLTRKLGVPGRSELFEFARESGLLETA
ncbi:MAG: response regulator transcription factor [Planctomycetota bacterium]